MLSKYQAHFVLRQGGQPAPRDAVIAVIERWLTLKEGVSVSLAGVLASPPADGHLRVVCHAAEGVQRWGVRHENHVPKQHAIWTTEIGILHSAETCEVSTSVMVALTDSVAPRMPVRSPAFVRDLLAQFEVLCGVPMEGRVQVVTRDGVQAYFDLLSNPDRQLPVVAISCDEFTERPLVSPDDLFRRLAGMSHVVLLEKRASFVLWRRLLEKFGDKALAVQWGVQYGGARVYWPKARIGEEFPFRHRLWDREEMQAPGVLDRIQATVSNSTLHRQIDGFLSYAAVVRLAGEEYPDLLAESDREVKSLELELQSQKEAREEAETDRERQRGQFVAEKGRATALEERLRTTQARLEALSDPATADEVDAGRHRVLVFRRGERQEKVTSELVGKEGFAEALEWISYQENWENLAQGRLSRLEAGLYEYRWNSAEHWYRLFLAYLPSIRTVVVLHWYAKTQNQLDPNEVRTAKQRLKGLIV